MANSIRSKRKIESAADHSEIVVSSVHDVPAKIGDPPDAWRNTDFHTAAKLSHDSRFFIMIDAFGRTTDIENPIAMTAEDSATTSPRVRSKTRTANRVTQCNSAKSATD